MTMLDLSRESTRAIDVLFFDTLWLERLMEAMLRMLRMLRMLHGDDNDE
jgi:hypothetical protein